MRQAQPSRTPNQVKCTLAPVLRVVYRAISGHLIDQGEVTHATGVPRAVTVVRRFGSALKLNAHLPVLFLNGVYLAKDADPPVFRPAAAPCAYDLQKGIEQIAARVGQVLERRGLIERDIENPD